MLQSWQLHFTDWHGLLYLQCCSEPYFKTVAPSDIFIKALALWVHAFYKLICPYLCVSVCLSVCVSVHFWVTVKMLPPLPEVGCQQILEIRNLRNFLSNKKKWSQIWKLLLIKNVKLMRKKKFIFGRILPYWAVFLLVSLFLTPLTFFLPPLPEVQCRNFFNFQNPRGKRMKRNDIRFEKLLLLKGVKLLGWKKFFTIFVFFICSLCSNVFLHQLPEGQCPKFLDFWNPWGKVLERSCFRFESFCF